MKNFLLNSIFILFLLFSRILTAQDTNLIKYLPLNAGNLWVYYGSGSFAQYGPSTWYDRYRLASTTQINGKTYFVVNHTRIVLTGTQFEPVRLFQYDLPIRVDSVNLNAYKSTNCGSNFELLVDSLRSKKHDTATTCFWQGNRVVCEDTSLYNIFGSNKPSKKYVIYPFEGNSIQIYVKNIGVVYYGFGQQMTWANVNLRGCIINGILFGDTSSPVGIHNINTEIPDRFRLYENYPNPFNPSTTIKFQIPGRSVTRISVYDIQGREVALLLNEELNAGVYELSWDASNLGSGVYIYRVATKDNSDSKRMVLLK